MSTPEYIMAGVLIKKDEYDRFAKVCEAMGLSSSQVLEVVIRGIADCDIEINSKGEEA